MLQPMCDGIVRISTYGIARSGAFETPAPTELGLFLYYRLLVLHSSSSLSNTMNISFGEPVIGYTINGLFSGRGRNYNIYIDISKNLGDFIYACIAALRVVSYRSSPGHDIEQRFWDRAAG